MSEHFITTNVREWLKSHPPEESESFEMYNAVMYIHALLADREALVRYVRAVTSWANEQMDVFKERDVLKKREYEAAYEALSQELKDMVNG